MNKIQTREDLLRHINQKESELKEVASKLKQDFVGLDNVINDLISSIKIWYIFPELQLRPTIVCLWGLTGVGKTDMVRKLVSYLKIQDRFLEIEMTSSGEGHRTIQHRLEESSISSSDQCILLLDEFQKFRTIDEDGTATQNSAYSDVWTLLSDGKFSSNLTKKTELLDQMLSNKYYKDWSEFENSQQEDSNDDDVDITETMENGKPVSAAQSKKKVNPAKPIERIYYTPVYLARRIKRLFRLEEDIETIMRWKDQDIYNLYDTCLNNTKLYEGEEYKKMLIIVSGNLDEAYHMAFEVSEADADADFYHGLSKKITVIDIKDALLKRFRPEQIARFGNSHILYPSLSRKDFMEIIVRKCKNITDLIKTQKDISFNLDKSVYEVIYNNGVFPTQGVRPLLSTITNILSVAIPTFIYKCLLANINVCDVFVEENKMYAYINNKKEFEIIPTILDQMREEIVEDKKYACAVHELGHAVIYCLLYNTPPAQICVNSVSAIKSGFIIPHAKLGNKSQIIDTIRILLAGQCAENMVFGHNMVSDGSAEDIKQVTSCMWNIYCKQGLDRFSTTQTHEFKDYSNIIPAELYLEMDNVVSDIKHEVMELLVEHQEIYKFLLTKLLTNETLNADDFIEAFQSYYNIKLNKIEIGKHISSGYKALTEKFISGKSTYVNIIDISPESKPKIQKKIPRLDVKRK